MTTRRLQVMQIKESAGIAACPFEFRRTRIAFKMSSSCFTNNVDINLFLCECKIAQVMD